MHKILQNLEALSCRKLHWMAVGLSILIAAQVQYIQHGWINPDSVLYLEAAKLFTQGAWQAGFDVFNWPFYALCIAFVSKITTLNVHLTAQILNVLFFSIATYSFIQLIQLAGGKQRQIIVGALIWLSAQYMIGGVLEMLLRDEGFWAFFLTSIVFFIRFYKSGYYSDAFFWQISAIAATLFRIEAITYLLLLPFSLFFYQQATFSKKIKQFLKCNFLSIIAIIGIFFAILIVDSVSMKSFGRLNEVFTVNLYNELTKQLFTKSTIMSTQVLGRFLDEFAVPGLLMTFIYIIIIKSISATGIVNIGLAAFAMQARKRLINDTVFYILIVVAIIALLNMSLIIVKVFVLSGRYVLALSFVLMILAAFYLADLLQYLEQKNQRRKKIKWIVIALLAFMFLSLIKNILPKQDGYNYMQDAIAWIDQHNLPKQEVFYDDKRMRYYAGLPLILDIGNNWLKVTSAIEDKSIYQYNYVLITFSAKDRDREKLIAEKLPEYHEIKRFNAVKAKKSVVLYQKVNG